jgi:hypothetical protein
VEKIIKYRNGINTSKALKEELGEYVNTKLYIYILEEFTDNIL